MLRMKTIVIRKHFVQAETEQNFFELLKLLQARTRINYSLRKIARMDTNAINGK